MFTRKTILITFIGLMALLTWVVIAQAQDGSSGAAGQYGSQTTASATTQTTTQPPATGTSTTPAPRTQQYNDSPESVAQLLRDSDTAMKAASDNKMGVHIAERSFFSIEGESTLINSEGDIMMPDRVKLQAEVHLPKNGYAGRYGGPLMVSIIGIGDTFYLKPVSSSSWTEVKETRDQDELISDVDLEAIHFYDYIKSSSIRGRETLPDGTGVYHVQVEIDTPKIIDKMKSVMDPAKVHEYGPEFDKFIEQLKTSAATTEVWVGVDNHLVYQAVSRMENSDLQISADDAFQLSRWGEVVDISAPTSVTRTCTCRSTSF